MQNRYRCLLGLSTVVVIVAFVTSGPLLVVHDERHAADAIVVIGGDHKPERMRQAADLYHKGYAPLVIISAGTIVIECDKQVPEAQVMYRQAHELGLPDGVLILEQESKSTYENAAYTKAICQGKMIHSIILVTSAYHSRRARRVFQSVYSPDISVSAQPSPSSQCAICWPFSPDQARVVAYEYWNWMQYWLNYITARWMRLS